MNANIYSYECIKCGNNIKNSFFHYKSGNIPVCGECKKEFNNFNEKYERKILYLTMITLSIGVIAFFITNFATNIIIAIITTCIIATPYIIFMLFLNSKENNPSLYIKRKKNLLMVKPQGKGTWIIFNQWINKVKQEDKEAVKRKERNEELKLEKLGYDGEHIYCPKCGEQLQPRTDFCPLCGKNLKVSF